MWALFGVDLLQGKTDPDKTFGQFCAHGITDHAAGKRTDMCVIRADYGFEFVAVITVVAANSALCFRTIVIQLAANLSTGWRQGIESVFVYDHKTD